MELDTTSDLDMNALAALLPGCIGDACLPQQRVFKPIALFPQNSANQHHILFLLRILRSWVQYIADPQALEWFGILQKVASMLRWLDTHAISDAKAPPTPERAYTHSSMHESKGSERVVRCCLRPDRRVAAMNTEERHGLASTRNCGRNYPSLLNGHDTTRR